MSQLALNSYQSLPQYHYCVGETIPCSANHIYLCISGVVLIATSHATGEEGLLGLVTPSLPFGLPLSEVSPYRATALTAVSVYRLHIAELRQCPRIAQQVLPYLIESLKRNEEFLIVSNRRSIAERFEAFLALLCRRVGRRTEEGVLLDIRLTHQQIANAINATRVSVTRLLTRYREEGIVVERQQKWIVREAGSRPPAPVVAEERVLTGQTAGV
ncbi:MAG: Crp/Fnr family transcriptional regulator [Aphanocapsa lilacina HA4352-LM1]|jgi:CRP-like cAMP-binding protein|nr:Crp/Fnr family transcriptional regulator [Aphanocapsa lilacina HA4352-LM1]